MLKFVDSLMHVICVRHTNSTYISKFQVNTVTNIEVIRQNVFSHARVMVIGVRSDLKHQQNRHLCDSILLFVFYNVNDDHGTFSTVESGSYFDRLDFV